VSAAKIVLLVFGIILAVIGLGMTVVGGGVLGAHGAFTDDDGYFTTKTLRIDKESHAVVSEPTDMDVGSWWVWDWGDLAYFKVEASNDDDEKGVFMGIADEHDLDHFLSGVEYHEITDFDIRPDRLEYRNHPGTSEPEAPTTQAFWLESVSGPGDQTLEWELESGSWSFVLMNDDGSAGVDISVIAGVKIPWLHSTAVGLLAAGVVGLVLGIVMIVLAARRPRGASTAETPS
jgi:hypothetical protein